MPLGISKDTKTQLYGIMGKRKDSLHVYDLANRYEARIEQFGVRENDEPEGYAHSLVRSTSKQSF